MLLCVYMDVFLVMLNINLNFSGEGFFGFGVCFFDLVICKVEELMFVSGIVMIYYGSVLYEFMFIIEGMCLNFVFWFYGD